MRVYLPLTYVSLREATAAGRLQPPLLGFAVTPGLREWYASGDAEELEFAAMTDAAGESLRRLAEDSSCARRRVVLAVDVSDADVRPAPDRHPAAVLVSAAVPRSGWASVHVDDDSALEDLAAAAALVPAADAGEAAARFVVEGIEDHQLQWYAIQEIEYLPGF